MILSESEKNRIRGLHREASVVKTKIIKEGTALGVGLIKKIVDKIPTDIKDKIEKETDKSAYVGTLVNWMKGNSGILPGDQTELKKNIKKYATKAIDYLTGDEEKLNEDNKRLMNEGTIMYELQDEFEEGKNEMVGKYKAVKNGEDVSLYLDGRLIDLTGTVRRFK